MSLVIDLIDLMAKHEAGELRCPATALIDWIFFILVNNKDNHNILDEFEFRLGSISDCGVSCHGASGKIPIDL